ncbi:MULTISPECIES: Pr6Pr family membrane protein [Cryobacterium]|uniref:Pr6Pr family membrane protein n=1 Tax=Cryobacterium TaxID=69578 RepID=UPI002410DE44|nr:MULTISPECIES: Pr6Pr family membrane protein [Cryobacterium]
MEAKYDGVGGLWRAIEGSYDAIILDIMLPGRSGFSVCGELRDAGVWTPILKFAELDWLIFSDRSPLPWNELWIALIYPIVWIMVVLIRGATDGWVPYPFFNPAQGYGVVALYALTIAVATIVFAATICAVSRSRPSAARR